MRYCDDCKKKYPSPNGEVRCQNCEAAKKTEAKPKPAAKQNRPSREKK